LSGIADFNEPRHRNDGTASWQTLSSKPRCRNRAQQTPEDPAEPARTPQAAVPAARRRRSARLANRPSASRKKPPRAPRTVQRKWKKGINLQVERMKCGAKRWEQNARPPAEPPVPSHPARTIPVTPRHKRKRHNRNQPRTPNALPRNTRHQPNGTRSRAAYNRTETVPHR